MFLHIVYKCKYQKKKKNATFKNKRLTMFYTIMTTIDSKNNKI